MDTDERQPQDSIPVSPATIEPTNSKNVISSAPSFLHFPGELRNAVYDILFPAGASAVQLLARHKGRGYIQMSDRLGLLTTCRQVYGETSSFLRCQRRFTIVQPRTFEEMCCSFYRTEGDGSLAPNEILDFILPPEGLQFNYDLEYRTLRKNIPTLLYASRGFRFLGVIGASSSTVTVKITTHDIVTTFGDFHLLHRWFVDRLSDPAPVGEAWEFRKLIILYFNMTKPTNFSEIRIQAGNLTRATFIAESKSFPFQAAVQIEFAGEAMASKIQLCDLYTELLYSMRQLIVTYPEFRSKPCPELWIDGHFRVRGAVFLLDDEQMMFVEDLESWQLPAGLSHLEKWNAVFDNLMVGLEPHEPD